jgi:acyl-[acyl-carrier-protein] desaturase
MVGDTITEEALPTYESWLMEVEGVDNEGRNGWSRWVKNGLVKKIVMVMC